MRVQPLGGEDPLEGRAWQPTCLENPRDRNMAGYRSWGRKEADATE